VRRKNEDEDEDDGVRGMGEAPSEPGTVLISGSVG
jgi:hypothetical protein